MNLIEQEVSTERWIDIPEEVLGYLKMWRPTPLYRARRLEKALGTPAKIYYKNEGVSPAGSHKPNTAVAQAYYNKEFGIKKLTTEPEPVSGVQHSHSQQRWSVWSARFFMVRISFDQKALPQDHDADLGRQMRSQPEHGNRGRPQNPG